MTDTRTVETVFPIPRTIASGRVLRAAVLVAGLGAMTGCESVPDYANPVEWYRGVSGWFDDEAPAPTQTAETPGADQDFPSLGSVPERPEMTVEERRRALREGLAADTSGGVQYSNDPLQPQTQLPPQPAPQASTSGSGIQPLFGGGAPTAAPAPVVTPPPLPAQNELPSLPPLGQAPAQPATAPRTMTPQTAQAQPGTLPQAPSAGAVFGDVQPLFGGSSAPQTSAPMAPRELPSQAPTAPRADDLAMQSGASAAPRVPASAVPGGAVAPSSSDPYLAYYSRNNPALIPQGLAAPQAPTPSFQQPTQQPPMPQQVAAVPTPARAFSPTPAPAYAPTSAPPTPPARPRPGYGEPIMNRRSPAPSAMGPSVPQAGAQPYYAATAPVAGYPSGQPVKAATIFFDNGSSGLTSDDRGVLRQIAQIHKQQGGAIQIVGHASNRTRELRADRHELVNFRMSVARAESVRRALIGYGVKANAISVGAQGDSQPVYAETMPSGEAGNRRAEVFMVF